VNAAWGPPVVPGCWYLQIIKRLFKENGFAKGELVGLGLAAKPSTYRLPNIPFGRRAADDITAPGQVLDAAKYI
jgi:poly-beta-hydroxyalkanoate depolymerase